jgi:small-conductance mechanosensitive channel
MRAGVVRVIHDGQIDLRTDGVDAQSPMLVNGETVPVMSRTGFAVRRLASNKVLTALLTGLAVVALALFCFRRLARVWLLLLAVVLAGWSAWLALPWASDAVTRIYTLLPQANPTVSVDATQSGDIKSALLHFMHQPPSPEIVAYCGVFLLVFIILSMGVFASLKRFEKQN